MRLFMRIQTDPCVHMYVSQTMTTFFAFLLYVQQLEPLPTDAYKLLLLSTDIIKLYIRANGNGLSAERSVEVSDFPQHTHTHVYTSSLWIHVCSTHRLCGWLRYLVRICDWEYL